MKIPTIAIYNSLELQWFLAHSMKTARRSHPPFRSQCTRHDRQRFMRSLALYFRARWRKEKRGRERGNARRKNGAEQEKNDRGQRRWVSGTFARKPNRLPRDCGAMADSWLRARVIGERTEKSMRSSTRFRFGWGVVWAFSHRTALVSHTIPLPIFSLPRSLVRLRETDEEEINASSQNLCTEKRGITKT